MSNDRYLIVSYFLFAFVSVCLGGLAYRALRVPFVAIAERVVGRLHSSILKRALAASMTMAAVLGFLSFSYTQKGCINYEQVVKDREYLVQANREQLQGVGNWIAGAALGWGVVVAICLVAMRSREENSRD
jgi:uncharacterized MnhB-related membrane protein